MKNIETKDRVEMSKVYYNKQAKKFDRSLDGFFATPFKSFITKEANLQPQDVVLDVGCANGKLLGMLKEKEPTIVGAGVDISDEMVKVAHATHPEFDFQVANAETLPFENNTFDWLFCSASFHHFPRPKQFLQEARRVLKPNGRIVIAEIHFPKIGLPFYNYYIDHFNHEGDVKVYAPNELKALLNDAGFVVKKKPKYKLQVQLHEAENGK